MPNTHQQYRDYRRWMRYIKMDHPKLDAKINRVILLAIAWTIAEHGDNGLGCYPGNQIVADALECNRETVRLYRKTLLDTGWFRDTGRKARRVPIWDINIPDRAAYELERQPKTSNTRNLVRGKGTQDEPSQTLSELAQIDSGDGLLAVPEYIGELEPTGDPWG